jgi:hypothetical protein
VPLPPFERFVAARARGDGDFDVAAVARDNTIVLARVDPTLHARTVTVLATAFTATEETSIALLPGGAVVVEGRIADRLGTFLLDASASKDPVVVGADWCEVGRGVAWLVRDPGGVRVAFHRAALDGGAPVDATGGVITVAAERETRIACGPDDVVVAARDGEDLSMVRLRPTTPDFATPPAPIDVEHENELEDELRDRFVDARAGDEVVVVRVGERAVFLRIWGATLGNWTKVAQTKPNGEAGHAFALDEDADVIDVVASSRAGGPVYVLASEPMAGECKDGDPPRRIVLHAIAPAVEGARYALETRRPIVELACGVEAIAAHLSVDAASDAARLWWTEPVADGSCSFPGLAVAAVVDARSDAPGAKRHAILAEGAGAAGDGKWVAVLRAGGCAAYDAPGNGTIEWVP